MRKALVFILVTLVAVGLTACKNTAPTPTATDAPPTLIATTTDEPMTPEATMPATLPPTIQATERPTERPRTGTNTRSATRFTNAFGTPTTRCAHPGCSNFIASSGDTNCCTAHSNRCLQCGCYIDEDAMFCLSCIADALS